jgi:hypothetical protein
VGLRAGGAGNRGGARCGVCGDARCVGWGAYRVVRKVAVEEQWELA